MVSFLQTNITPFFGFLTLLSHIVFVVALLLLFASRNFRDFTYGFVYRNISALLFTASTIALIGSLSYSEIIGFPPCELCWIQRIFMYPQALLSFIAFIKKDKGIIPYLLGLSVFGLAVSFFHSLIHWGWNSSLLKCSSVGAPCAKVYVLEHGYITIPFMSFTIFAYLITLIVIYYRARRQHGR